MPGESLPPFVDTEDALFLATSAESLLGRATVASVTLESLKRSKIDVNKFNAIFEKHGAKLATASFEFKKINGDPESPEKFGVLIRRRKL